jgi:hypothetical protein
MPDVPWIPVRDFSYPAGWSPTSPENAAALRCRQLEQGEILFFDRLPFDLPGTDNEFLLGQNWSEMRLHKNVSYRPIEDRLNGFGGDAVARERLQAILRNYSRQAVKFLESFLSPYAGNWVLDFASFRPLEERGRNLSLHKRNDLLHVDSFPTRPTRGGRILRIFTNLNPTRTRVWQTTSRFDELARKYAMDAGLARVAGKGSLLSRLSNRVGVALGLGSFSRPPYDRFMLRFHDYLKENSAFQANSAKTTLEFPPMSTWIAFTDGVPHAVLSGQYALEQTFLIRPSALTAPESAPYHILESLCGRPLIQ